MHIYFLTRQPEVCQLLGDKFVHLDATIKIYPTVSKLFQDIFQFDLKPAVIFLDYHFFFAEKFDISTILGAHKKNIPVVYYNHPYPIKERRIDFWNYSLSKQNVEYDDDQMEKLLKILSDALQDPSIYPYISGIQEPKKYYSNDLRYIEPMKQDEYEYYVTRYSNVISEMYEKNKNKSKASSENKTIDLISAEQFKQNHKLSHKLSKLFTYLYENINTHVSIDQLLDSLSNGMDKITPNGLRIAVYRLRNILKEDDKINLELISYDFGYALVEKN